jgi:regulator of cell morphogenesis and NO signaling
VVTRDQIINDVMKTYPDTMGVFNQFRVDSCCGGGRPIAETAADDGLRDLTPLLHALNRAARKLGEKNLSRVVEEIEGTHHVYMKNEVPHLQQGVARLAEEAQGGPAAEHASELNQALRKLATEVAEHIFKEEQILFPTIRQIEEALSGAEPLNPAILGCGTQGPVAQMNYEHEVAKAALERIAIALEGVMASEGVPGTAAALRPKLQRLRDDLLEHIRAEEEDLFPRALELEARVLERLREEMKEED